MAQAPAPVNPVVTTCEAQAWQILRNGVSEYKTDTETKNKPLPTVAEVTVNTTRAPFKDYGETTYTQEVIKFDFERGSNTGWTLKGHTFRYEAARAKK